MDYLSYTILISDRLPSDTCDVTERTAFFKQFEFGEVHNYSNYLVQFQFALCDFLKYGSGLVKVRQKLHKTGL